MSERAKSATSEEPLSPEEADLQLALRKAAADLYEFVGRIDFELLPYGGRPPAAQIERSVTGRQIELRRLVSKIDGGRISMVHALRIAFGAETFARDIFLTSEETLPYIAIVFEHDGVTYAIAENPEIGNATYVYAEGPNKVTWRTAYGSNREDARILYGAMQLRHPRSRTAAEHMEHIIDALVEAGLPRKVATKARYALRDFDPYAGTLWGVIEE